jgi:pantoate--beta-alanine ligase
MVIFKAIAPLQAWLRRQARYPGSIGFVPTMGALHNGHLSLIASSLQQQQLTVCSIFVNPTQFNNAADFQKYPITIAADIALLESAGCDVLFLPTVAEIYPQGTANLPHYNLGPLENLLEGKYRPGHFQGVCQVMERLLQAVEPANLYMGSKDYQQCLVVQQLLRQLPLPIQFHAMPTLRQANGLAMSSRNQRLSPAEADASGAIYQQLQRLQVLLHTGTPPRQLEATATAALLAAGFSAVDYVSIADGRTLQPLDAYDPQVPAVGLVAAFMGEVRLIDNLMLQNPL